ncbi:MAG: hypothetical protein QXP45_04305 [Thermoproteota archaeon]
MLVNIIVSEKGNIFGEYYGEYLPAAIYETPSGLGVGILALPSGGNLTLTQESLVARGFYDPCLLAIAYPSGEKYVTPYVGGALQIPLFSYASGAFVAVQTIPTRIALTGSIDVKKLLTQVLDAKVLFEKELGTQLTQELLKNVLLNGFTDTQVLDIVNTIVKELQWLKVIDEEKRSEAIQGIMDGVNGGKTASEVIESLKGYCINNELP